MDNKNNSYKKYIERISNENIPAYEPDIGNEELELLKKVIDSNWISEGKYVREFEEELRQICERDYALAFNNCTAALITGMKSSGLGSGDDVVVQSLIHSADPNAISVTGANPVFAEVDKNTLCLSPETIEEAKTPKTKAVLYVSVYGNTSNLDDITNYCNENKLLLINDCAPALFGTYKDKPIASYGDFSALSFFSDKTITTGEGGMLLTNNLDLINECNIYKHDGRRERGVDLIERKGFNFRITEFQAAVGVAQLKKRNIFIEKKRKNYKEFHNLFKNHKSVSVFEFNPDLNVVPHRNIIFVDDAASLINHLVNKGIGARSLFMPMHSQPAYSHKGSFPISEDLYKKGVCLPSAPSLTPNQVEYIYTTINNFYI